MPVHLLTLHTHGSWMVDREEGHHDRRAQVTLAAKPDLARHHRASMRRPEVICGAGLQRQCIGWLREAAGFQRLLLVAVATSHSHLHSLVAWSDERDAEKVRGGLKRSVTAGLRRTAGLESARPFFSKGGDCFRVRTRRKFRFHRFAYLPDHPGWFWDADRGLRPPTRGQRLVERWRLGQPVPRVAFPPLAP